MLNFNVMKMNRKQALLTGVFALLAIFFAINAQAGSGGSAFSAVWTEISGWADGTPGKIITLLAFFAALFNVLKQNYYLAMGAFLGAMLLANAVTIINVFLTGTIS